MRKPDVIVAGMPRSGTTWLFRVLNQHPDVFIPENKEINFFNKKFYYLSDGSLPNPNRKNGLNWYFSFFEKAGDDKITVDMSILTALDESSAKEVKKYIPDAKIIFCLRDPVGHAYSMYRLMYAEGDVKEKTFEEYLKNHKELLSHSKYYEKIKAYFDEFGRKNVLIIFMDDIKDKPAQTLDKVLHFIGAKKISLNLNVDQHTTWDLRSPRFRRFNKSCAKIFNRAGLLGACRWFLKITRLDRVINKFYQMNIGPKGNFSEMMDETRKILRVYFKEDLDKIHARLGIKMPKHWSK